MGNVGASRRARPRHRLAVVWVGSCPARRPIPRGTTQGTGCDTGCT